MKKQLSCREKASIHTRALQLKAHIRASAQVEVPIELIVNRIQRGLSDAVILREFSRQREGNGQAKSPGKEG